MRNWVEKFSIVKNVKFLRGKIKFDKVIFYYM